MWLPVIIMFISTKHLSVYSFFDRWIMDGQDHKSVILVAFIGSLFEIKVENWSLESDVDLTT